MSVADDAPRRSASVSAASKRCSARAPHLGLRAPCSAAPSSPLPISPRPRSSNWRRTPSRRAGDRCRSVQRSARTVGAGRRGAGPAANDAKRRYRRTGHRVVQSRRSGGDGGRSAHHQLRGRGVRRRQPSGSLREQQRLPEHLPQLELFVVGGARRLERREDGTRSLVQRPASPGQARRAGRDRPHRGGAGAAPPRRTQAGDARGPGGVRSRHGRQPATASGGGSVRQRAVPRHVVPHRQARGDHRPGIRHRVRRRHPAERTGFEAVRRRGPADAAYTGHRARRVDQLPLRHLLGAQDAEPFHRQRRALGRRFPARQPTI